MWMCECGTFHVTHHKPLGYPNHKLSAVNWSSTYIAVRQHVMFSSVPIELYAPRDTSLAR